MKKQISLALLFLTLATRVAPAAPQHPLDALEAEEIAAVSALLSQNGIINENTPLLALTLDTPPKAEVLAWSPGMPFSRTARAIVRSEGINREYVVDVHTRTITGTEEIPGPGQPPLVLDEIFRAIEATVSNPEMQNGLRKRGITDFEALFCAPRTVGNFGAAVEQNHRLVKVDCFDLTNNPTNVFASPIEGLYALVDIEQGEVLQVNDLGVVPVSQTRYSLAAGDQEQIRSSQPVRLSNTNGGNIEVEGWMVRWQNWKFHLRFDTRAGLIVSMVQYLDGDRWRSILYEGNISEIYVPYQDPTEGWYYRNYMDEGDYGIGTMHSPLAPGADCADDAIFLSPVMANTSGGADVLNNRICLFEIATGAATWRHYDFVSEQLEARPNIELVVRFIAALGNYDYAFDWVFDNKGQLTVRIGASGLDSVKGVAAQSLGDPTAADDTRYGPLVAPGLAGIQHDHFFSIRLDVDVDGTANRFVRDKLVPVSLPPDSPRRSIWTTQRDVAQTDSQAKFRLSYEHPSLWRVESASGTNALGYANSYAIKPAANASPLVDESDTALQRAQFANFHLWVTPYDPDERWAGGRYSNQSRPGNGLPQWTQDGRNIDNTDIVLWYTLGFHHVPSAEDWPVYNLGWNSVTLRPYNFFDQNPAMDLPEAQE